LKERRWRISGAVLVVCHVALLFVSFRFGQERPLIERPVLLLVGLELLAGVAWLAAVWPPVGMRASRGSVVVMLAVGAILRGLMLPSTPILEDDFYRYLWDGAVVAHGHNPYTHAPQEFLDPGGTVPAAADGLRTLGRDGQAVLARINHPSLRTIYPPVAQGAFALAHWLAPWSLIAWRVVLLLFDAATVALLLLLLRRLARSPLWAAIYWWNPLLVLHGVNGAHMDLLALPFVLGAILLTLRGRQLWGIACMAVAAGVKLWPVILLPCLLRPLVSTPRRLMAGVAVAGGMLALMAWPAVHGVLGTDSGFVAYAQRWEMNDALFMALLWGIRTVLGWIGSAEVAPMLARLFAAGLLAGWVAWLVWRPMESGADMARRMLLAVAGLFLLSPTQFPWYGLWMLPLLALSPRFSLLLLMVLLSLYHARYYFDARDSVAVFDNWLVWLEYVPVWVIFVWEGMKHRASRDPVSDALGGGGQGGSPV
jgi:hypothetical protein